MTEPKTLTPHDEQAIAARAEAATAGPWHPNGLEVIHGGSRGPWVSVAAHTSYEDTRFIAHARQDIPDLLATTAALRAELRSQVNVLRVCGHDAAADRLARLLGGAE